MTVDTVVVLGVPVLEMLVVVVVLVVMVSVTVVVSSVKWKQANNWTPI